MIIMKCIVYSHIKLSIARNTKIRNYYYLKMYGYLYSVEYKYNDLSAKDITDEILHNPIPLLNTNSLGYQKVTTSDLHLRDNRIFADATYSCDCSLLRPVIHP